MKNFLLSLLVILLVNLTSCSNSDNAPGDSCEGIICQNGGECQNGSCACPEGYMGANCETEREPLAVSIEKIVVREFPNTNGGADIYIKLLRQQGDEFEQLYESDTYFKAAISPGNYTYILSPSLNVYNFDDPILISLYDYNWPTEDAYIGSSGFFLYEPEEDFPLMKTVSLGNITADVYLSYDW